MLENSVVSPWYLEAHSITRTMNFSNCVSWTAERIKPANREEKGERKEEERGWAPLELNFVRSFRKLRQLRKRWKNLARNDGRRGTLEEEEEETRYVEGRDRRKLSQEPKDNDSNFFLSIIFSSAFLSLLSVGRIFLFFFFFFWFIFLHSLLFFFLLRSHMVVICSKIASYEYNRK